MSDTEAPMFKRVRPPRTLLGVLGFSAIALTIMVGGALFGQRTIAPLAEQPLERLDKGVVGVSVRQFVYLVAGFGPVVLLLGVLVRIRERRPLTTCGFGDSRKVQHSASGALVGLALVVLPLAGGLCFRILSVRWAGTSVRDTATAALIALVALAFQSSAEELVFRGWLLPSLLPRLGVYGALGASSLAFAAVHLLNSDINLLAIVNLSLLGSVLGLLTLQTRSLWAAAAAHTFFNWTQLALIPFGSTAPASGSLFLAVPRREGMLPAAYPGDGFLATAAYGLVIAGLLKNRRLT